MKRKKEKSFRIMQTEEEQDIYQITKQYINNIVNMVYIERV